MTRAQMQFMRESGPRPDKMTYNAILHVCGRCGHASVGEKLLRDMRHNRLEPDIYSYCCLLDACAKEADVKRAQRVLGEMTTYGLTPNVFAFTSLMDACIRDGRQHVLQLVRTLLETADARAFRLRCHL
jgi:pentatricopeptide repeat protein